MVEADCNYRGRLEGASVIVTGAGRGIGKAIARRLVAEGANVMLADKDEEAVAKAAAELRQSYAVLDVCDKLSFEAVVERTLSKFGSVQVLVNNAGIFRQTPILDLSAAEFDEVLAVNLKSVLYGIQAVAPAMIERGGGAIVNVASLAALLAMPGTAAYSASKAGVVQLTNAAAVELARFGVRVNGIGPGTIQTEMAASAYGNPGQNRQVLSRIPMGRPGLPEEIASVAAFLASQDSSYMTGKTLYVDGGRLGLNLTLPGAE